MFKPYTFRTDVCEMSFKLPSLRKAALTKKIAHDLPSFEYNRVEEKELIGHGAYGTVVKGRYNNEIVVAKKLHGESEDEENCFVKEAKLMHSIKHDNVGHNVRLDWTMDWTGLDWTRF